MVIILICIYFIFTYDKLPILFNITFPNLRGKEEEGGGTLAMEFCSLADW